MIIAVDFDGTIVKHEYPKIGKPVFSSIYWIKRWIKLDAKIILYTMRSGNELQDAVKYLEDNDIDLYGVNKHPEQYKWSDSPKVYANIYVDDASFGCPIRKLKMERAYVDWEIVGPVIEKKLMRESEILL